MSQWLPVADIAAKVQSGQLTARALVDQSLKTIAEKSEYDAIIVTLEKRALERAAEIDAKVGRGDTVGALAGVPFIAKDNFLVFGADTTAGSNILKGFEAPYQATAINRLEAAGAICVAKANMDAFAIGSSTENSDFFTTKNPHDMSRVPGGTSGGSATSVVLDMVPFAIGTDTGGSIRQPASFTGCVGYKPTYGLVSRSGVVAAASSTDVIGPLTRSIEDAALVLDVMAGIDALDSTTISRNPTNYTKLDSVMAQKKVGVIKEYMGDGLQPSVRQVIEKTVDKLKAAGAEVREISLPSLSIALSAYYIIIPAEEASNLSRYDGQRCGYSYSEAKDLEESYSKSRGHGFGSEVKRRIMVGTYVLSSGYYDAYYKKAQTVRTKLIYEFNEAFKTVEFLVGPTAPTTAFKIGENTSDPLQMYLADVMTVGVSLAGIPAVNIPAGTGDGLPVGLQIMAAQQQDHALLSLAKTVEELVK